MTNGETPSLVVQLRYGKGRASNNPDADTTQEAANHSSEQQPPISTQQESGVNGNGPTDTTQDADFQMQLDETPAAAGQSLESHKEQPNGFSQGPHVTSVGQPAAVGTETG